jgi:putative endonuclease
MTQQKPPRSRSNEISLLGESFVATWLQSQQWQILDQRWRCQWGELDLVAVYQPTLAQAKSVLAFVEVKTRSQGNWDANGALSVTYAKQAKLWKAAEAYLTVHPHLAELPCQFDVALVGYHRQSPEPPNLQVNQLKYGFTLIEYLPAAFSLFETGI